MNKFGGAMLTLVLLQLLVPHASTAREIAHKVDVETAYRLVAEAVGHGEKSSDFDYQKTTDDTPFLTFAGLSKPPAEGLFGFFDVNPWTGDVWSVWSCKWLTTPQLRKSQAAIKQKFGLEELKLYRQLHRLQPECDFP
jgi:hypothetical protein